MARNLSLSDREWALVAPLLPSRAAGKRRLDDRVTLGAILFSLATGTPWRELPPGCGNHRTLMSRCKRWEQDGTLNKIMAVLRFEPMPDDERHRRRGYGEAQRRQLRLADAWSPFVDHAGSDALEILSRSWGRR